MHIIKNKVKGSWSDLLTYLLVVCLQFSMSAKSNRFCQLPLYLYFSPFWYICKSACLANLIHQKLFRPARQRVPLSGGPNPGAALGSACRRRLGNSRVNKTNSREREGGLPATKIKGNASKNSANCKGLRIVEHIQYNLFWIIRRQETTWQKWC